MEKFSEDMSSVSSTLIDEASDWIKEGYRTPDSTDSTPSHAPPATQAPADTSSSVVNAIVQASTMENVSHQYQITVMSLVSISFIHSHCS